MSFEACWRSVVAFDFSVTFENPSTSQTRSRGTVLNSAATPNERNGSMGPLRAILLGREPVSTKSF